MNSCFLPWPVSVNMLYIAGRKLSPKARRFYNSALLLMANMEKHEGRVCVEIDLYPNSKRRYDADNTVKCVLDALVRRGVIEDDHLVWELVVRKHDPVKGESGAVVTVGGMESAEPLAPISPPQTDG